MARQPSHQQGSKSAYGRQMSLLPLLLLVAQRGSLSPSSHGAPLSLHSPSLSQLGGAPSPLPPLSLSLSLVNAHARAAGSSAVLPSRRRATPPLPAAILPPSPSSTPPTTWRGAPPSPPPAAAWLPSMASDSSCRDEAIEVSSELDANDEAVDDEADER